MACDFLWVGGEEFVLTFSTIFKGLAGIKISMGSLDLIKTFGTIVENQKLNVFVITLVKIHPGAQKL